MIAEISFSYDSKEPRDRRNIDIADEIFDEILRYGKELVQSRMPRGIIVYAKDRYSLNKEEL